MIIILLVYLGVTFFYGITTHLDYKIASEAFPIISQRDSNSLLMALLYIETIATIRSNYICGEGALFNKLYNLVLENEKKINEYMKSSKSIFKEYKEITSRLNSEELCLLSNNVTGKYYIF